MALTEDKSWSPAYAKNVLQRLETDIFPDIGKIPIALVSHRDIINALRKIESRGAHEIAKRDKAVCAQIVAVAGYVFLMAENARFAVVASFAAEEKPPKLATKKNRLQFG